MRWLLIALVLCTGSAYAESLYLYTGAVSMHFEGPAEHERDYNQNNKLLALQYGNVQGGWYHNTFYEDVFFLGMNKGWKLMRHVEGEVAAGINYGYANCIKGTNGKANDLKKTCPYLTGALFYTEYTAQPGLLIAPTHIAASLRWEF